MNREARLKQVQEILQERNLDGWLIFDFHRSNDLAHQFLGLAKGGLFTRRFFYWIPAKGEPVRILHQIEPLSLQGWPGSIKTYLSWQSLHEVLKSVLKGKKQIAMEFSFKCAIPYISKVDGGTLDLIRSFGIEVVSSGDFLPYFTAVMDEGQIKTHVQAGKFLDQLVQKNWKWIAKNLKEEKKITEYDVVQKLLSDIDDNGYAIEDIPIVGVNENSGDPHYLPMPDGSREIRKGDFVLIDVWAKKNDEHSIFADITRVGLAASGPSEKQKKIFHIVRDAQKTAIDLVRDRYAQNKPIAGWEVDEACRAVIRKAGFEKYFTHRTGHSIEESLHGSGAHLDNFEMHDVRHLLPGTCFSVEPGIYLPNEFGVRLESDVLIDLQGKVHVTGGEQDEIFCFL